MKMRSFWPTLRANTLFKKCSKPAYQTHYFQMSQTSLYVFDINVKLINLAKKARKLKVEDRMDRLKFED